MKQGQNITGVLDRSYALLRERKIHSIIRYKIRARVAVDAARKYLDSSRPLQVLDFGSAEGLALLELQSLLGAGTYEGVEFSEQLIRCAPKLPADIKLIKGDITVLPESIKPESYDMVTALAVLEHLSKPVEAVRQAARVLRPGGIFIATCVDPFWDSCFRRSGFAVKKYGHLSKIGKRYMTDIILESGLEPVDYKKFIWGPIGLLSCLQVWIPPLLFYKIDEAIRALRIFDWSFVNQCVVARKVDSRESL